MVSLIIAGLTVTGALATVLRVPSQYPTIQAGIDASVNGDTVLVADGTYTGNGNKELDFGGRAIVVMSENGPESCIIDCQGNGRGFYFHNGETATAEVYGLTVKNGHHSMYGGGINITNSNPAFRYCVIVNCSTWGSLGGGVYICNSNSTFDYCVIANCRTDPNGGGIYISGGNPVFQNCTFYQNTAHSYGGGIYAGNSDFVVNSCIFAGNSAYGA